VRDRDQKAGTGMQRDGGDGVAMDRKLVDSRIGVVRVWLPMAHRAIGTRCQAANSIWMHHCAMPQHIRDGLCVSAKRCHDLLRVDGQDEGLAVEAAGKNETSGPVGVDCSNSGGGGSVQRRDGAAEGQVLHGIGGAQTVGHGSLLASFG
jgi:hypothetical protein